MNSWFSDLQTKVLTTMPTVQSVYGDRSTTNGRLVDDAQLTKYLPVFIDCRMWILPHHSYFVTLLTSHLMNISHQNRPPYFETLSTNNCG